MNLERKNLSLNYTQNICLFNKKEKRQNAKMQDDCQQIAERKGIALVIVLGFLAILTLIAVGMAISMRTERLASNSYMDMVQARMFCQSALAYSMQDMEDYLA